MSGSNSFPFKASKFVENVKGYLVEEVAHYLENQWSAVIGGRQRPHVLREYKLFKHVSHGSCIVRTLLFLKYIAGNTPDSISTISSPLCCSGMTLLRIFRFMFTLFFGSCLTPPLPPLSPSRCPVLSACQFRAGECDPHGPAHASGCLLLTGESFRVWVREVYLAILEWIVVWM